MAAADPWIAALRASHETLVTAVSDLDHRGLTRPSFCEEWEVSRVLGHLGSGAEIGFDSLDAARAGTASPPREAFPTIWARWDAMAPAERRDGFVAIDEQLVAAYESLDDDTRSTLTITLGFVPDPLDVETIVGFRLSELALHSWDVRMGADPRAHLDPAAVALLLNHLTRLAAFVGRSELAPGPTTVAIVTHDPARQFTLSLGKQVALTPGPPATADATLSLPAETLVRLVAGRLPADRTDAVTLEAAALDLHDLRAVFPGF